MEKHVRWYPGSSNVLSWIHIDSGNKAIYRPNNYGWRKKTLCCKFYEVDSAQTVKDEQEIANRLCRRCAQQKRKAQRSPDVDLSYEVSR